MIGRVAVVAGDIDMDAGNDDVDVVVGADAFLVDPAVRSVAVADNFGDD